MDSDDLDPEFAYEEYTAKVKTLDANLSFVPCNSTASQITTPYIFRNT